MGVEIALENIPDKVFIDAVRRIEVVRAKVLSRQDKKALPKGSPDVLVRCPLGKVRYISRNEVLSNYSYLNGKKIKMFSWRVDREYLIAKRDKSSVKVMCVPNKYSVRIGERVVKSKNYIVCLTGSDGSIDRNSVGVISRALFRRLYTIPNNDVFNKYINGNKNRKSKFNKGNIVAKSNDNIYNVASKSKLEGRDKGVDDRESKLVNNTSRDKVSTNMVNKTSSGVANKFTTIGRLVNDENKVVGFIVKDSKGMAKQVNKSEMVKLCKEKLVDNIVLTSREGGSMYLRGNGIKIDDLKAYKI